MIHFSPSLERVAQLEGQFQSSRVSGELQTPASALLLDRFLSQVTYCSSLIRFGASHVSHRDACRFFLIIILK